MRVLLVFLYILIKIFVLSDLEVLKTLWYQGVKQSKGNTFGLKGNTFGLKGNTFGSSKVTLSVLTITFSVPNITFKYYLLY